MTLTACLGSGIETDCAGWKSINPSSQDVLTRGTAEQILGHNLTGVNKHCWKMPTS